MPSADGIARFIRPRLSILHVASLVLTAVPVTAFGEPMLSADNLIATFQSSEAMAAETSYQLTVAGSDLAGNALSGTAKFSFKTGKSADTMAPTVVASVPENAAMSAGNGHHHNLVLGAHARSRHSGRYGGGAGRGIPLAYVLSLLLRGRRLLFGATLNILVQSKRHAGDPTPLGPTKDLTLFPPARSCATRSAVHSRFRIDLEHDGAPRRSPLQGSASGEPSTARRDVEPNFA